MVVEITNELGIARKSLASTTWDRPEVERGIEADECYLLTAEKVEDVALRRPRTAADCPIPDLAIEIDMRRSEVDRAEIYATLGVPEVWRFDGKTLRIDRLGPRWPLRAGGREPLPADHPGGGGAVDSDRRHRR